MLTTNGNDMDSEGKKIEVTLYLFLAFENEDGITSQFC